MPALCDSLNAFLDLPQVFVPEAESGALSGLSIVVKDIFDVAGLPTGCGNPDKAREAQPARRTAPAIQALLDAGARFAGKTQTEELAFSLIGQNIHFPHPVNPAAPDRVTGGSSSGSAAAVAGRLADIAIGSDTGGSIRAPASFCGLIGLRTTHGRLSLEGAMPLAPSMDTFGWFAKDAATYETVGDVLLGPDVQALATPRLLRLEVLDALVAGPSETAEFARMRDVVTTALGPLEAAPAPPFTLDALYRCFRILQAREAWAAQGKWISERERHMAPAVKERFAFGATISLADAVEQTALREAFRTALADLLGTDGVLVLPTVPSAAPFADSTPEMFAVFRERALRLLCWASLSGFPQITLPLGSVDGAPFGISLLGPAGSDRALIRLARKSLEAGMEA